MKLRTALLTAAAAALAACTPAADTPPAPATPDPAPIADASPAPSGPAAENTTNSLSSIPGETATADPAPAAPATPAMIGPTAEELANGRALYAGAGSCALCHGPAGQGTPMGVALTAGLEYAAIKEKISKGMINPGDKMPPMGAALSAEQLDDLAKFVEAGLPQ